MPWAIKISSNELIPRAPRGRASATATHSLLCSARGEARPPSDARLVLGRRRLAAVVAETFSAGSRATNDYAPMDASPVFRRTELSSSASYRKSQT